MSENEEIRDAADQHHDPAEVLANMAANQPDDVVVPADDHLDPSEALDQMAQGEPAPQPDDELVPPAGDGDVINLELAEATGVSGGQTVHARQAHAASAGRQMAAAHHHAYKRWMMPLLVIVGVLLILVGLLSGVMLLQNRGRGSHDGALALVLVVSFPLAAVMIFGAWWFRREVRRAS